MATLTGPLTLPDGTAMAGASVKVRLVAGDARQPGHVNGAAIAGVASTTVDENGNFSVQVPALNPANTLIYPAQAYYDVVTGGGRWPKYQFKVKPLDDSTYVVTDPAIGGETEDLLPPEFVQIIPDITTDDIAAIVTQYFIDNPIDVGDAVDAANAANPPLYADQNLAELVAPADAAAARLNIGAASDSDTAASIAVVQSGIDAINLAEATSPAVRAPGYSSVTFSVDGDGIISFEVDGAGGGGGSGSFQPLDSDLTAIAALTTTSFGRGLLTLANAAALRTTIGPSGTPDSSTFLRGDGNWATPAGGGGSGDVATDSIWDAAGDLAVGSGANTAAKLTKGSASTFLRVNSAGTGLEWAAVVDADLPSGLARDSEVAAGYQPLDADLTAIAALTTTSYGRALLALADAAALRTAAGVVIGTNVQAFDADLSAIAALTSAADKGIQFTGSGTAATYDLTTAGKALLDDADAAAQRTTLGLADAVIGDGITDVVALTQAEYDALGTPDPTTLYVITDAPGGVTDPELAAIAGLTSAADKGIQFTGSGTAATYDLTTAGKALLDDANASAQLTTLGVSTFVKTILDDADAAAVRGTIGLGTAAVVNTGTSSGDVALLSTGGRFPIARIASGTPDGTQFVKDDGTLAVPSGGGGGSVATDTLWDAKGDLAGGTGSNTASRLAVGTNGHVLTADSAETTGLKWAAAGSGAVSTDTIWDAAGDLAVGSGANTAAKLTMGSSLQVLRVNSGATALEWAAPSGGSSDLDVAQQIAFGG